MTRSAKRCAQFAVQLVWLSTLLSGCAYVRRLTSPERIDPDLGRVDVDHDRSFQFARGELTTLDNGAFDPERASAGMWQPVASAKTRGFGLFFLEPYDPDRIPVLFVHGLQGSPRDFAHLIAALDTRRYQAWVLSYPSGLRLPTAAHLLSSVLVELRQRLGPRQVAIVAHSMGGLVARAAVLELARENQADFLHPLLSISTPYGGHAAAANGLRYAPQVVPAWIDLAPGSPFLVSLQTPLPPKLPFYLFFGMGEREAAASSSDGLLSLPGQLARFVKQDAFQFFGMGARTPAADNDDGVVSIPSQLASFAKRDALEIDGFDSGHVGILSNPAALQRAQSLLAGTPPPRSHLSVR